MARPAAPARHLVPELCGAQPVRPGARVLVVESDPAMAGTLRYHLERAGYGVELAADGEAAVSRVTGRHPDLVVLDLLLPGTDGFHVFRRLRQHCDVPVVMFGGPQAGDSDRIFALDLGADDFVPPPVFPQELAARVRSILRRREWCTSAKRPAPLRVGPLMVDERTRRVEVFGRLIALTALEFRLLVHFMRHPGEVCSRETLLREVWGYSFGGTDTVTVHVRRLREKIEHDPASPRLIRTVWGEGYRLKAPAP